MRFPRSRLVYAITTLYGEFMALSRVSIRRKKEREWRKLQKKLKERRKAKASGKGKREIAPSGPSCEALQGKKGSDLRE
jgi:hypothetical protein